jgi:predicted DsbA family dithiol-disulfide isomerase
MSEVLEVDYFSDVLCIWAWIAERKNHELLSDFALKVELQCVFLDLFSNTRVRIGEGWKDRGGYEGFGEHVRTAAAPYEEAPVHADVWDRVRPTTSANAHLVLKAAEQVGASEVTRRLASLIRRRFFVDAVDVGQLGRLYEIADEAGLSVDEIRARIEDGRAIAALLSDSKRAHETRVSGSPTWVMNTGRQMLYGNVGYRVLRANVEELLDRPEHEASWC